MAALAHLLGSRAALLGPRLAAYFGSAKEAFEASSNRCKRQAYSQKKEPSTTESGMILAFLKK